MLIVPRISYALLFILAIASCTISEPANHKIQENSNDETEVDKELILIDSFLYKDSTELQILTKELTSPEKCHSCSPPIILRRSSRSRDGKITWKEAEIDATNQWGDVGHFYVEELEDCPELLFLKVFILRVVLSILGLMRIVQSHLP